MSEPDFSGSDLQFPESQEDQIGEGGAEFLCLIGTDCVTTGCITACSNCITCTICITSSCISCTSQCARQGMCVQFF